MENAKKILLVEDDNTMRSTLGMFLESEGHIVAEARSAEDAVRQLSKEVSDLVVTDLKLGGMDGMHLLRLIRKEHPDTNVVLISAYGDIDVAVESLKAGAADFLEKPFTPPVFLDRVRKALLFRPNLEVDGVKRSSRNRDFRFDHLVGRSLTVKRMKDLLRMAEDLPDVLLLSGESGTGKESMARRLHEAGSRAVHPFVSVSCAALTDQELELELFGNAVTGSRGILQEGQNGTLFLDEIHSLSAAMQVKILRMLESRRMRMSGSAMEQEINMQVICGTTRNLEQMTQAEQFRQDLYYRISVVHLSLDPLRNRLEDIPLLMDYFLEGFNRILGKNIEGFGRSVFEVFMKYDWPGNVRELQSVIERMVIFCQDSVLQVNHVPEHIREPKIRPQIHEATGVMTLKDLEKAKILETLQAFKGNKATTAKALGIGRNTLWRKLKEYGIDGEDDYEDA